MAGAQQLLRTLTVQADRAARVRADLRKHDVSLRRPIGAIGGCVQRAGREAQEQRLRRCVADESFREDGHDRTDLELPRPDGLAVFADQPRARRPLRLEKLGVWVGTEGSNWKERRNAENAERRT